MTESNESKHATETREAMSALLDGEATEFELARLLKESEQSAELRDYWIRQSRYRDSARGVARYGDIDVSHGVRAAITQEPKRTANPLVSMAVAATVTIAVVLVGNKTPRQWVYQTNPSRFRVQWFNCPARALSSKFR